MPSFLPFTLPNLPLIALIEVIKKLGLQEQILLSLCSKKTRFTVKRFRDKTLELRLNLHGESRVGIHLFDSRNSENGVSFNIKSFSSPKTTWSTVRLGVKTLKFQVTAAGFDMFYKDQRYGTQVLLEYILDLFQKKVDSVFVMKHSFWMMGLVEKLQKGSSCEANILQGNENNLFTDTEFWDILVRRSPKDLYISHNPSEKFQIDNFSKKYGILKIKNGHWLTIDNLLQLDCQQLEITNSQFTGMEINRFLKHWLAGGATRLKTFSIQLGINILNELFNDNFRKIPGEQVYQLAHGGVWIFNGGILRRDDGVMASFGVNFALGNAVNAVWPDFDGNSVKEIVE